ncbi:hypothetical protein V8C42DRAFT_358917 [Trichoderma barbatum]
MERSEPETQPEGNTHPTTQNDDFSAAQNRDLACLAAERQLRSERAHESHRRRMEREEQATKEKEEQASLHEEKERLRAFNRAKKAEMMARVAAEDQAAYHPVDSPETTRLSAQKRRASPTATEPESTAIKRWAKLTNDNTSSPTTAAPAIDEHHRTTQSVAFQTKMPATAEVSATCLCVAHWRKIGEDIIDVNKKLSEALEEAKDMTGASNSI